MAEVSPRHRCGPSAVNSATGCGWHSNCSTPTIARPSDCAIGTNCRFADAGAKLGVSEEAMRKRYHRALPKLARKLESLRSGAWRESLDED